jgi:benzoylformate decarboxylase
MTEKSTVRSVTFDLLRSLRLTTVFGNPGSTEQPFLQEFPDDFSYVLALQEASVIAMADAFAQVTRRPALVNPRPDGERGPRGPPLSQWRDRACYRRCRTAR